MRGMKKMKRIRATIILTTLALGVVVSTQLLANTIRIPMFNIQPKKPYYIGYVIAKDTKHGLLLTPNLHPLPPGVHGFHIHSKANCSQHGKKAGSHLDPKHTNKHLGPYSNKGHLGDLPVLYVNKKGEAKRPVLAPRLNTKLIRKHSLMIHVGGDNYSDKPTINGGGGARLACGVIH